MDRAQCEWFVRLRIHSFLVIDADRETHNQIATYVNRFVKTDLLIILPVSCTWCFVLYGRGWTDDLIGEVQSHSKAHFSGDDFKVVTFANLAWFDKLFRVSVNADDPVPASPS